MDLEEFRESVRDVLSHLYDRPYLQTHPLAHALVSASSGEVEGQALQRRLLAAIDALKPSAEVPYDSLAWRKYRYLYLRYVQGLPVPEIADDLGISLRQSRRYAQEALAAVTDILAGQCAGRLSSGHSQIPLPGRGDATIPDPSSELSFIDQEVARLKARSRMIMTPIQPLLVGVVATIESLARQHGRAIRLLATPTLPSVAIDRAALRQALLSILSLILGSAAHDIEVYAEVGSGSAEVTVVVGCVPHDVRSKETHRLYEDDRWHVAEHLLRAHGGTLDPPLIEPNRLEVRIRVHSLEERRVLVVDDNPDAVELYRRYLADGPYRLLAADDGMQALALAEVEQPAVVMLDVMMPSHDGWEILQMLKSQPQTQEIPVIICSVLKERDLALALGAAEALVKPVGQDDLLLALERHCFPGSAGHPGIRAGSASGRSR